MVGQKLEGCWKQLTELKGEDIEAAAFEFFSKIWNESNNQT